MALRRVAIDGPRRFAGARAAVALVALLALWGARPVAGSVGAAPELPRDSAGLVTDLASPGSYIVVRPAAPRRAAKGARAAPEAARPRAPARRRAGVQGRGGRGGAGAAAAGGDVGAASEALLARLRQRVAEKHAARLAAFRAGAGKDGGGGGGGGGGVSDKGKAGGAGAPPEPVLEVATVYRAVFPGFAGRLSEEVVEVAKADPEVAFVEEEKLVRIAQHSQALPPWNLDRIDQRSPARDCSYTYNSTGCGVHVYVVDTGIYAAHAEFEGRASMVFDAIRDSTDPNSADCNGHGTHCAGTIGSRSYGAAKQARLYGVKVLSCSGSGTNTGVVAGMDYVIRNHRKPAVMSMSLGGSASDSIDAAVARATDAGILVVVAAGNENTDACAGSPARAPPAVTVGATTSSNWRASYSNFGECVDIFAPGSAVPSTWIGSPGATNTISGTSMATPLVAGVAALYLEAFPAATPAQVTAALLAAAAPNQTEDVGQDSPNLLLQSVGLLPAEYRGADQCWPCPTACLNGGRCVAGQCSCGDGWSGAACESYSPWAITSLGSAASCATSVGLASGTSQAVNVAWTYAGREARASVQLSLYRVAASGVASLASVIAAELPNSASGGSYQWTVPEGLQGYHFLRISSAEPFPASSDSARLYIAAGCGAPVVDTCSAPAQVGDLSSSVISDSAGRKMALFRFVAPTTRSVMFSTCNPGSEFDTMIMAYNNCPATGSGGAIGSNDDSRTCSIRGTLSDLTLTLTAGVPIYVAVVGYNGATGKFEFSIKDTVCNPLATPAPTALPGASPSTPLPTPPALVAPRPPGPTPSPTPPIVNCNTYTDVGQCPATTFTGTTVGAQSRLNTGHASGEVVYSFTPATGGYKTISLCSPNTDFDTVLSVFAGCPGPSSLPLAMDNDGCGVGSGSASGRASLIRLAATAGMQYTIAVEGYGNASGRFELTIVDHSCPNTPSVSDSPAVQSCGPVVVSSTVGRPNLLLQYWASPEAYFVFAVPTQRTVTVSLCSSLTNFDSFLHVFAGDPLRGPAARRVVYDDDGCGGTVASRASFVASANTNYTIVVEGFANFAGTFAMQITDSACSASTTPTPAPTTPPVASTPPPRPTATPTPPPPASTPAATPPPSATPPPNCDALPVFPATCEAPAVTGSTVGAPRLPNRSSGAALFVYTAATAKTVRLKTCGPLTTFDTVLAVYRQDQCPFTNAGAAPVVTNDDACGRQSIVSLAAEAGVPYLVTVSGFNSARGNFSLALEDPACPPPENCTAAAPAAAPSCGGPVVGSTVGAVRRLPGAAVPASHAAFTSPDALYTLRFPTARSVSVSLCEATSGSFDTVRPPPPAPHPHPPAPLTLPEVLYVFRGCPLVDTPIRVADNDDGCPGSRRSQLAFSADAGVEYWVAVAGYGSASGTFVMRVTDSVACPAATPTPTPLPAPTSSPAAPPPAGEPANGTVCGAGRLEVCSSVRNSTAGLPNRYRRFYNSPENIWGFVAPRSTSYVFSLCGAGSTYDTFLSLHRGCPLEPDSALVASNDDACSRQSRLTATLAAGVWYTLVVEGYSLASGNYSLAVTYGDGSCGAVAPAPALASATPEPAPAASSESAGAAATMLKGPEPEAFLASSAPSAAGASLGAAVVRAASDSADSASGSASGPAACSDLPSLSPCKAPSVYGSTLGSPSRFFPGFSGAAYSLSVPTPRTLAITLCGAAPPAADLMLGVMAGCDLSTFTFDHSGCGGGAYGASVQGTFLPGVSYQILVEGWRAESAGAFHLTVDSKDACGEAAPAIRDVDESIARGVPVLDSTAPAPAGQGQGGPASQPQPSAAPAAPAPPPAAGPASSLPAGSAGQGGAGSAGPAPPASGDALASAGASASNGRLLRLRPRLGRRGGPAPLRRPPLLFPSGLSSGATAAAAAGAAVAAVAAVAAGLLVYRRYVAAPDPRAIAPELLSVVPSDRERAAAAAAAAPAAPAQAALQGAGSAAPVVYIGGTLEGADSAPFASRRRPSLGRSGSSAGGLGRSGAGSGAPAPDRYPSEELTALPGRAAPGAGAAGPPEALRGPRGNVHVQERGRDAEEDAVVGPFPAHPHAPGEP
eukprot:tig00020938_g16133.t1